MQVAGENCLICTEKIFLETEGTWCARCNSILCCDCAKDGAICTVCRKKWDDPKQYFVYIHRCFSCFEEVGKQEQCGCGALVRWNNQEEYDEFAKATLAWISGSGFDITIRVILGIVVFLAGIAIFIAGGLLTSIQLMAFSVIVAFLSVPIFSDCFAIRRSAKVAQEILTENQRADSSSDL